MHVQAAFAKPDGCVQTGETTEADFKRRDRSTWPKGTILFCKQRVQFGIHRLQPSRTWRRKPSPFLFLFFSFLFLFLLLSKILLFVGEHLRGRLMRALVGIDGRFAYKVILGAGLRLAQDLSPFVGLGDDLFQHLTRISVLLIKAVHVVLE